MLRWLLVFCASLLATGCGGGGGSDDGGDPDPTPQVQISVTPATAELAPSGSQQFACSVTGTTNTQCTWSVANAAAGTVTAAGLYTAPTTGGVYQVRAASAADPTKTAIATVTVRTVTTADRPWVTGYYAAYNWDDYRPERVDMTAMTHFVFARIAPGGGTLGGQPGEIVNGARSAQEVPGSPYAPQTVEDFAVSRAHAAGIKALIMIGGAYDGAGFYESTSDAIRPRFVRALVDYMVRHDYDGIDVDWEDYLTAPNDRNIPPLEARRRLKALLVELRTEANSRPRYQGAGRQVIITFPWYAKNINFLQPGGRVEPWEAEVAMLVDQFNLMSYGAGTAFNGGGWQSWFSGPIYGATGLTPTDLNSSVNAYVATGVPRRRIGIGIGFYGMYYGPRITGPRQSTEGNSIWQIDDNALAYNQLVRKGYLNNGTYHWDATARVGYRTYAAPGYVPSNDPGAAPAGFLSYDDEASIRAKGQWVRHPDTAVGGTIIWTINYGWLSTTQTNPLLSEVKSSFLQ